MMKFCEYCIIYFSCVTLIFIFAKTSERTILSFHFLLLGEGLERECAPMELVCISYDAKHMSKVPL
jgi:hypothetical protein